MEELSFCALKRKKRQNSILSHITSLTEKHKIILVFVLKDSWFSSCTLQRHLGCISTLENLSLFI